MDMGQRKPVRFSNGIPELLVLRLLADREMYGYELVGAIRESTADVLDFGEGVIYPLLHSLEAEGLLTTRRCQVNGRPRVYYRTTAAGRRRLKKTAGEWSRITAAVGRVLGGTAGEPATD